MKVKTKKSSTKSKKLGVRARIKRYLSVRPHRSFRPTDRPRKKLGGKRLPASRFLILNTIKFIYEHRKIFFGLTIIYAIASYLTLGGISQDSLVQFREAMGDVLGGQVTQATQLMESFTATLSGEINTAPSEGQKVMGTLLAFAFWLANIWAARMLLAGNLIKVRDTLYNCCAPLLSTLVVLGVVALQLLPGAIGLFIFSIAQGAGILKGGVEVMMFVVIAVLLGLMSMYWLTSSIIALVIVTLPQMYPFTALRNSGQLVIGQRVKIAWSFIAMFVFSAFAWAAILLPILVIDNWLHLSWLPLIPVTVQILTAASLVFSSVYIYKTYRELI